jgi:hypothetical protein
LWSTGAASSRRSSTLVNLNAAAIEATHPLIQKALTSLANLD